MADHGQSAAVVVGVDAYPDPALTDLHGAVGDARAMARLLVEHVGFPPDRVVTLYDDRATAARIESALGWLGRTVGPQGTAVFFFAGHGAQRFDDSGDEADGFDETVVPHDSGRGPRPDRDLTDDWLRIRLAALAGTARAVTAIFDCCHSGTLGRDPLGVRQAPPGRGPRRPGPRLRPAHGSQPFTLLAAAAAGQLAHERAATPGEPKRGVFTRALVDAIEASTADDTWRTVMTRVAAAVRVVQPNQDPQLEGAGRDRRPFSSALPRSRWALAEPADDGFAVALGRLHGVEAGDVLELLPLHADEPRLRVRVADAGPISSRCVSLDRVRVGGPLRALPPPGGPSLWDLARDPAWGTDPFRLVFDADGLLDDDGATLVTAGETITLRFDNSIGGNRLHLGLVLIDPDGEVTVALPDPGGDLQIAPFTVHEAPFEASLPPGRPGGLRWRLVLVACTEPFDLRPLEGLARTLLVPAVKNLALALYAQVVRITPPAPTTPRSISMTPPADPKARPAPTPAPRVDDPSPTGPARRWRALLIGIDRYRHVPDLAGAVSDVERARRFLEIALGLPPSQIATLTNEDATRSAMLDALMALGDADLQPDDQVLVHYSGHGAHMRDPRPAGGHSPSGYIESLVAHDSGRGGGWNIPDYIVGALLDRIARKAHLTVVLDCCHSGSGTRRDEGRARTIDPDGRAIPPDLDRDVIEALGGAARAFADEDMRYTVLAACRDRERALEHSEMVDGEPRSSGLFSWCLYRALEASPPGTSYRLLMERVAPQVSARAPYQHPQCAGRWSRQIFGGADVRVDAFVTVARATAHGVTLDAGTIQGLGMGDVLALYPADVRTRAELAPSAAHPEGRSILAFATVTRVNPTESRARLDPAKEGAPLPALSALVHARAVPLHPPTDGGRVQFVVEPGAPPLGEPPDDAPWRMAAEGERPEATVVVRSETLQILDSGGVPRIAPRRRGPWIWGALTKIARFDRLARLRNPDPGSRLQDGFEMRIRDFVNDPDPRASAPIPTVGGHIVLAYDPLAPAGSFMVEAVNRTSIKAALHVLLLSANVGIDPLYPTASGGQQIDPGKSLFIGHRSPSERIEPWLPGDAPGETLWTRSRNMLLLIASQKPMAIELLKQSGLDGALPPVILRGSSLERLLLDCARGNRMLRRKVAEDWGVTRVPVDVVRRPRRVGLWSGRSQTLPIGVELLATGVTGHVSAAALDRHTVFEPIDRPPLERMRAEGLLPVPSPALGAGDSPLVLRLEGRAEAGASIALTIPEADAPRVPLAFDRGGFTVIGRADGAGRLHIEPPAGPLDLAILFARKA